VRKFFRGMGALDSEEYEDAARLLGEYVRRRPSDFRARLWLARAQAETGHTEDALALLNEVGVRRPRSAVPHAFAAMILLDAQRFDEARAEAEAGMARGGGCLSEALGLVAAAWLGNSPGERLVCLVQSTSSDLAERALHVAETQYATLPSVVMRDVMDEVGIGWPGYRFPPPWLCKLNPERGVLRQLSRGMTGGAFQQAAAWDGTPAAARRSPTMIAAAMLSGEWERALAWALLIPQYRAFADGDPPRRSLNHFQVSLFRGFCTLMRGDSEGSLEDLGRAASLDSTSYLPRYLSGRAMVARGLWCEARRQFVAACQRLNPSLAVVQLRTLI